MTHLQRPTSEEFGFGIYSYDDSTLSAIARTIVILVASLLPLLSTIVSYVVEAGGSRLWLITGLSAAFALALVSMTDARTIEVFEATAA